MRQLIRASFAKGEGVSEYCADPLHRGCGAHLASDPEWVELHWTICDACSEALAVAWGEKPMTMEDRLKAAGVPPRYRDYDWAGCEIPAGGIIGRLRGWRGVPRTVYLHGDVGAGKSGAAVCLIRERLAANRRALYIDLRDWLESLRYAPDRGGSRVEVFDTVAGFHGLLVLDELVTERVSPDSYQAEEVTRLVDQRIRYELTTVVIGNHPLEGDRDSLSDHYGPRLASRLSDGLVFEWRGPDRRGRTEWAEGVTEIAPPPTPGVAWMNRR